MPTQRKRPADFTGLQTERLNEAKAADIKKRAAEMALATTVVEEEKSGIICDTGEFIPVETAPVEVNDPKVTFRVNTDIENMTFGREVIDPGDPETGRAPIMGVMNNYNFEQGQSYRYPRDLVDHLDRLGYVAFRGS
jgi:hypothetical protein